MSIYPTNLTEKQWQVIKNIVEPQERNRKSSLREILNGIFYVNKSGCQWRMLPSDFAPWQTVYYYFRNKFPRLSKILADGGYQGDLDAWVKDKFGWELSYK